MNYILRIKLNTRITGYLQKCFSQEILLSQFNLPANDPSTHVTFFRICC